MKVSEINNNPLAREWEERYSNLPEDKKRKIDELKNMLVTEYQLKVIKRSRIYPEIGDIFKVNPKDDIFYYGIVINNHITSIYGKDLLVFMERTYLLFLYLIIMKRLKKSYQEKY